VKNSIIISFIILSFTISFFSTSYAEDPISIGKAAYEKGDFLSAIISFKEAVKKDKKNPDAYFWLGNAYYKADSLDQATAPLIQAREFQPENPRIYELLGDVYAKQRIYRAADEQYRKALEFDKKNVGIFLKLGDVDKKARLYKEAAEAYTSVLLIDSTNLIALPDLGTIYFRAKQYLNALPLFRLLVTLQPDSISYQIIYVKILYETKYYIELIPYAENILKKDPNNIEIRNMLRDAYVATKDYINAEKLFSMDNPDSLGAEDLVKRGKGLKAQEKFDEAIASYELAYKKDSTYTDIYYDLATLYNKRERYLDAVAMFEKKIAADSNVNYRWACYFQAAQSFANMKDYKKAKEFVIKSFDYKPEYIPAWDMLALYNGALQLTTEQSAAYKKVIELVAKDTSKNGGDVKYKNSLDAAYRSEGSRLMGEKKYPEAIEYFKKALLINPKDCALLLAVGSLYQRTKNEEEAQRYYCKVIQQCPKSEHAKSATSGLKSMGMDCK
jgi:tetratricopeptide (TPR) repeat protein